MFSLNHSYFFHLDTIFRSHRIGMRSISGWAWRIGGVVGVLWLVGVALLTPSSIPPTEEQDAKVSVRLQRAVQELDILKKQNDEMKSILKEFTNQVQLLNDFPHGQKEKDMNDKDSPAVAIQKKLDHARRMLQQSDSSGDKTVPDIIPSTEFEKTRRLLGNDIQETMFYFQAQLEDLKKKLGEGSPLASQVEQIMDEGIDRIRVSQHDLRILSDLDGLNLWREKEAVELSDLIQKRLHKLQNPPDCSKARKLICNLNKGCGYGCQIHHAVYCFIVAYGAKRTLILRSKNWRYDKNGWEDVFQPLSETCTDTSAASFSHWPGAENTQAVELPIVDTLSHRPPILPPAIPKDISERLIRFHGNPTVWWVGQFLKYMLRFQPKTQAMIDSMRESMGFKTPVVGIHIRRTDKVGTEAAFHSVEEYMERAEEYYKLVSLSNPNVIRRVYIASDDPKVITEARNKFPNYTIYGDPNVSKTAAVSTRYTDASLRGIIADIYFLSLSDYLVCTFSSQVCRLAYEILQTFHPDGADRFRSLDDIYYYGGQNPHNQRARFPHTAKRSNEMSLKVGDFVGVAGNHWDGFSKGFNRRSKQTGLYPSYKAEETVEVANVASYADFDKNET